MSSDEKIKLFALANSIAENSLDKIESKFGIDLKRAGVEVIEEESYYAQFESNFREESKEMSKHYEVFYCLERSIRSLVIELMNEKYGLSWWEDKVTDSIKQNVQKSIEKEEDSGYTQRSEEKIDYTTFGELGEIVTSNWEAFEGLFRSKRAFQKIMTGLNLLRGPIAHCCPLAEDEKVRLDITVKDWFRLMT